MAFLVFYQRVQTGNHSHDPRDRAIYLDQQFYELIYRGCRATDGPFDVLPQLALLQYKSPILFLPVERLRAVIVELVTLEQAGGRHPQIADFRRVCERAISQGRGLTVSGDMYPELWREPANPTGSPGPIRRSSPGAHSPDDGPSN